MDGIHCPGAGRNLLLLDRLGAHCCLFPSMVAFQTVDLETILAKKLSLSTIALTRFLWEDVAMTEQATAIAPLDAKADFDPHREAWISIVRTYAAVNGR